MIKKNRIKKYRIIKQKEELLKNKKFGRI